jgi:cysteine-S-conjugate beta-lyase
MSTPPKPGLHLSSVLTQAGRQEAGGHAPSRVHIANPVVQRASTVLFPTLQDAWDMGDKSARGEARATTYGTSGTETTFALCEALEHIEGAGHQVRAALQPSGLAAITTALQAFLQPGDHMLMADTVYGPARLYALGMLARWGVRTTFFNPLAAPGEPDSAQALHEAGTKVLYLESPGSYTFEIPDVPALAQWARANGMVSMIDNAWASPMFARPFDWGVDISLLPLTKYWAGHSDVLMGAAVVREEHWLKFWTAQRALGICVGGDDAYLVMRGVRTAQARMQQISHSAMDVAKWLERRPAVGRVLHPGLSQHPQHALFKRDFQGASGLFSFELKPDALPAGVPLNEALGALCNGRRHFGIGYSWGGYESLIMPAKIDALRSTNRWTGGSLIRLNIGLEHPDDLIDDLEQGFAALRACK